MLQYDKSNSSFEWSVVDFLTFHDDFIAEGAILCWRDEPCVVTKVCWSVFSSVRLDSGLLLVASGRSWGDAPVAPVSTWAPWGDWTASLCSVWVRIWFGKKPEWIWCRYWRTFLSLDYSWPGEVIIHSRILARSFHWLGIISFFSWNNSASVIRHFSITDTMQCMPLLVFLRNFDELFCVKTGWAVEP